MKIFLNKLFFSKCTVLICLAASAVSVLLNYSFRFGYVFIDNALFSGFSLILYSFALLNTGILLAEAALIMKHSDLCRKKIFRILQLACELFSAVFSIVVLVNLIVSGSESNSVAWKLCREILPLWLAVTGISAALFIIPNIKEKVLKKALAGIISAAMVFVVFNAVFPVSSFCFTSGPVVFDNGKNYSVVFSTSDNATAYIEYEYLGKKIRIYDENNGRKKADTIHTVHVPYEQLSGNTYKVFSTHIIDELSYGGRSGKTIESEAVLFKDNLGEHFNILSVSDWHTHNEKAKKAVSCLEDYQAVILLGDCAPGMMFKQEAADYLLSLASDLSGGSMPVLFARGNHETRGREAGNLAGYLGMESFYYTASLGAYNFIVLDSGEDKKDSHSEYGEMVVYEQNRIKMVDWLNTLENTDNAKTIALSHDRNICLEENLSETAHDKLDTLHVSLLVSGHSHTSEFMDSRPFPVLVDGGINAAGKGTYVASLISLSQDKINIKSVSSIGEEMINETVLWR